MNYSMGDIGPSDYAPGHSLSFLPDGVTAALGWVFFAVVALAFGYAVLSAVAETFKLGPYSPASIARAEARRVARAEARRVARAEAAEETDID